MNLGAALRTAVGSASRAIVEAISAERVVIRLRLWTRYFPYTCAVHVVHLIDVSIDSWFRQRIWMQDQYAAA